MITCSQGDDHGRWKCLKVGGARSGPGHGERVEREPITGVWGRSPQRGPGAERSIKSNVMTLALFVDFLEEVVTHNVIFDVR